LATTAAPPITVDQFLRFQSPRGFRCELINGEIILSPDPKASHYDICERIYKFLEQTCPSSVYKVLQRINLQLKSPYYMPSPDVMVIEYAKWVEAQTSGYPKTTPLLVAEVISPSNRKRAIADKVHGYIEDGVPEIWVIYPKKRLVDVHRGRATISLGESDTLSLPPSLPPASFSVEKLFSFAEPLLTL
jgi:Uma2 family endonuclease